MGNAWILIGRSWDNVINEPTDPNTESLTRPDVTYEQGNEWTLNNIRCAIAPNQYPVLSGWHVDVYVDNEYVITIYRDCNPCPLFTEDQARERAQGYLTLLQGWTR